MDLSLPPCPPCPRALAFFQAIKEALEADRLLDEAIGEDKKYREEEFNRAVDDLYEKAGNIPHRQLHEFKGEC